MSLYSIPMLQRPSVGQPFSKIFSKSAWPIKAKFHVEPPWEEGAKVCINGFGHMTKTATTPIYGIKIFFSRTRNPMILKLLKVYINDDPGLTLTPFYDKVKFGRLGI